MTGIVQGARDASHRSSTASEPSVLEEYEAFLRCKVPLPDSLGFPCEPVPEA